jgi:hypothetical protein
MLHRSTIEHTAPSRAAPTIIIIFGDSLAAPVVLRDWQSNLRVMQAIAHTPLAVTPPADRWREFHLALFWGTEWQRESGDARNVSRLITLARHADSSTYTQRLFQPELSNIQSGRLYIQRLPRAHAVIALRRFQAAGWIGGEVGAGGLALLRAYGLLDEQRRAS